MHTYYEKSDIEFMIKRMKNSHHGPHVRDAVECIFLTKGNIALGVGTELFPMEEGDFAVVFPDLIRHMQVFSSEEGSFGLYLMASPSLIEAFLPTFQKKAPENPVIEKENVHPDIVYAMNALYSEGKLSSAILRKGFLEVILSRAFDSFTFVDKEKFISTDIIDRVVAYIAEHFQESISEAKMAKDLYISPFALSRIFSSTFHTNFNGYLNTTRLNYFTNLLSSSDMTITEAMLEAGFESQRTMNRVFKETYHVSPSEWKKNLKSIADDINY